MGNRPNRKFGPVRLALAVVSAMVFAPAAAQGAVLYDSTPSFGGQHPIIQDFEASLDAQDTLAADDFTVPVGQTWTIDRALVDGRALSGPATTNLVNVFLFDNDGTLPEALPFYSMQLTADASPAYPDFNVALPGVAALGPGTYWFGAQARLDFDSPDNNQWLWSAVPTQRGNQAAYRNPGNGFGSGCTTFAVLQTCIPAVGKPDMSFRLEGTCAGCPVPPTTTPPTTAPAPKKCKKGRKLKKGKCVKKKKKRKK